MAVEQEGFLEDEATLGGPKFDPPLYLQRYNAVIDVARKIQARKVQWQSRMTKKKSENVSRCRQIMCYLVPQMWSKVSTAARNLETVSQVLHNLYNNKLGQS